PLVGLGVSHPTPTPTVILVGHVQFWSVPGHKTCGPRTIGVRCLQGQPIGSGPDNAGDGVGPVPLGAKGAEPRFLDKYPLHHQVPYSEDSWSELLVVIDTNHANL
ncbi:hypothetical protein TIFTF001_045941, partial [Ficus carica]